MKNNYYILNKKYLTNVINNLRKTFLNKKYPEIFYESEICIKGNSFF